MNVNLTPNNELSKLNCEKQGLCDIVTKYLGALKGGRQMSSLFPKRNGGDILMTTDTSMSFVKCLEIYQIRWNIEVVFKECKQHLGLEGCQSRDFDSQIADISLCFLIHTILTLEKRINDYESFGGMFRVHRDALLQKTLWKRNLDMLSRLLSELAPVFGWCVTDAVVCASAMLAKLNELIFGRLQSKHILIPC